jgi:membrane protease YdiL (CAAX protease family)
VTDRADTLSPGLCEEDWIALGCAGCWIASAALSRHLGIWLASGGAGIVLGLVALVADRRQLFPRLRVHGVALGAGLLGGLVMIAATYLLYPLVGSLVPQVVTQAGALYATLGQTETWRAALVLPVVITGEELVWRGAVQGALERRIGPLWAAVVGTLLYGLAVAPLGSPLLVAIALGCGLYWAGLRALLGGLVPCLVSHLLWSATVFVIAPLVPPGH